MTGETERAALVAAFARRGMVCVETGTGGGCTALLVHHAEQIGEGGRYALLTNGDAQVPWALTVAEAGGGCGECVTLSDAENCAECGGLLGSSPDPDVLGCVYHGDDCEGRLVLDTTASDADVDVIAGHVVDALAAAPSCVCAVSA